MEIKASRFEVVEALLSKSFLCILNVPGGEHMLCLRFHLDFHHYELWKPLVLKESEHMGREQKDTRGGVLAL